MRFNPTTTIDLDDLDDDMILDLLRACEQTIRRNKDEARSRNKNTHLAEYSQSVRADQRGRSLAAEAWARGLIGTPRREWEIDS